MTIAERVASYAQLIPAGTTPSNPATLTVVLQWAWLWEAIVRAPDGPRGTCGYLLTLNGTQIVPWSTTQNYYVPNNEVNSYPVNTEVDTNLVLNGYNTDLYDHTLYWRFFYTPVSLMGTDLAPPPILAIS